MSRKWIILLSEKNKKCQITFLNSSFMRITWHRFNTWQAAWCFGFYSDHELTINLFLTYQQTFCVSFPICKRAHSKVVYSRTVYHAWVWVIKFVQTVIKYWSSSDLNEYAWVTNLLPSINIIRPWKRISLLLHNTFGWQPRSVAI